MIFAITTFKLEKNNKNDDGDCPYFCSRCRTVGTFKTKEAAMKVLNKNYGDLNEAGYYPFAIIEEIDFGLYPEPQTVAIFKYDHNDTGDQTLSKWVRQESAPPEIDEYLKKIIGFVMIG